MHPLLAASGLPLDITGIEVAPSRHLSGLMRQRGLQQVAARFILLSPFESRFFKQLERGLARLPLGAQYFVTGHVAR
jgi:hypothetical protein